MNSSGTERDLEVRKRKKNLCTNSRPSLEGISRRCRAMTAKKCAKQRDAGVEL